MEQECSLPQSQQPTTCPYPELYQSSPRPYTLFQENQSYVNFPSTLRSSKWSFSLRFPHQNPVCTTPLTQTWQMSCPPHHSWCDHPNYIWWDRSYSSSLWSLLQYPYTSSLLGPNIVPITLFPNILSLRSYFGVRDQVSQPTKITAN